MPKCENIKNTKEIILKAAAEEFIEYGFYGARMHRIANRAKINKALIHYYFSNKENIYKEVLKTIFNTLIEKLNAIDIGERGIKNPENKMIEILNVYGDLFKEHRSFIKLLVYEVITGGKFLPQLILENINKIPLNPFTGKLYKYFESQIRKGNLRKLNVLQMLISLVSQMVPVYLIQPIAEDILKKLGLNDCILEKFIEERKKFILDILKNGIFQKKRRNNNGT